MALELTLLTMISIVAIGVALVSLPIFMVNLILLINYRKSDGSRVGVNQAWWMVFSGIKNSEDWPERIRKRVGYVRRMLIYVVLGLVISVTAGDYQQERFDQPEAALRQG
ncbi:hypothetical protein [Hahella ganghwensis]|uniref:hypothetical protein n=1 Tax=Hahella ganghwensis TaxID=286420 RepID=UPI0003707D74|nr:hypothetical protein [Hahella ganghwensis]